MSVTPSLSSLISAKQLERGTQVNLVNPQRKDSWSAMIEHGKENQLIVSCQLDKGAVSSMLGSELILNLETAVNRIAIHMEVVQEQLMWPILFLRMLPLSIQIQQNADLPLVKSDYIISVPYKVMGAKPIEEQGEAILLGFSPFKLLLGTDGYLAKGEYLNLSFFLPKSKQELVAMAQVVEKEFVDGSVRVMVTITSIEPKFKKMLQDYYQTLHGSSKS
ncbi:PilZ domain-containing protein [Brevibacillus fulvus]|uniref:PilZ domain-containing protein n=1 Tax=Brevibacillus fulvus TaxID=1125967 RepID=A0A938Y027_9BACL|nr:PilZ domain-containing protein [Brevibacillus fulvus]MBM7590009.1 hypothetical protein [Brevibacillus fulvus]